MPSLRSVVRRPSGAALIAVALTAMAAVPASATPVFPSGPDSPLTLTAPGLTSFYAPDPEVAANASGASVAAWTVSKERANKFVAGEAALQVSFRAAGAPANAWSTPIVVSAPDRIAGSPQVGIDAQGMATIAWSEFTNGRTVPDRVRVVTASGTALGQIQDFTATSGTFSAVSLAVAPSGSAVVAFTAWRSGSSTEGAQAKVLASRRTSSATAFTTPVTLSSDGADVRAWYPAAASSATGHVGVAWTEEQGSGEDARIRLAQASPGAEFSAPVQVSADRATSVREPELVIDPDGVTTVGWSEPEAAPSLGDTKTSIVVRRVTASGVLATPQILGSATAGSSSSTSQLRLATDAAGQVTAVWALSFRKDTYSSSNTVQVATTPPGSGLFVSALELTNYATDPDLSLAVHPSGATAIGYGGAGQTMSVFWRAAGASTFAGLGKVTDRWVAQASLAFGRGPDDLTVLFATDYAPIFFVQTATTVAAPATPAPTPVSAPKSAADTTPPTITIGAVKKVRGVKPKKGSRRQDHLAVAVSANEPAQLRVILSLGRPGIQKAGACVPRPSDPKQRRGRQTCVRTVAVGKPVDSAVGTAGISLDLGVAPPAGTYTVTVKATDAAGNKATPATKRFTLK